MVPTSQQVEAADRVQLARWSRFLPLARNEEEVIINNLIFDRFQAMGGMTPEISKLIGWDKL